MAAETDGGPMANNRDKDLGMNRPIARRDFLQGAAISTAALADGVSIQPKTSWELPSIVGLMDMHPNIMPSAIPTRPMSGRQISSVASVSGGSR